MKAKPVLEDHYGQEVWVNKTTEALRRDECLCLNCGNLRPNQPDNCPVAQAFFKLCVGENVALAVTRCPIWTPKEG
ncbi:hypothetical protein AMJ57_02240 [Parcubacteria bacterium SG8_24]|nr:MAG: hypothetical protein AMJ57_02240 [Parcubacteria bacterium SG8_24]